jgi:hypothetical protein
VSLSFIIELHVDDVEVLYEIHKNLKVGQVLLSKSRNSAKFYVSKFEDIVEVIIPIFQEFSLQTTKFLDFTSFFEASLIILNKKKADSRRLSGIDLIKLKKLKESMNSNRLEIDAKQTVFLENKVSINK